VSTPATARSPRAEYDRRLVLRRADAARWGRIDHTISYARLAVFTIGVVLGVLIFASRSLPLVALAPPLVVFVALLVAHDRVIRSREAADRAVAFYQRGIARLEHRFAGTGEAGDRYSDPRHPYAEDLDLFGAGSVFELLSTARTRAGEDTLAEWLGSPADPMTILARQEAIRELCPALDLREDISLLGDDVRAGLHAESVRSWAQAPPVIGSRVLAPVALVLATLTVAALVAWIVTDVGLAPFVVTLALVAMFAASVRSRVQRVIQAVDAPAHDLGILSHLLARLETEPFQAELLVGLKTRLDIDGVTASRRIARVKRVVELLDMRRNQLFLPVAALLLWTTQWALAIERWRSRCGAAVGPWIDAVGEFEALSALASYAYEHPDDVFPEIADAREAVFEGEALGHPLIPPQRCVRNDLRLGGRGELRVLVVSGSNMSGKSTMLRTVGTNAVLGLAGAPVCARRLRLAPLAVGASIRIRDSLQEGTSRFYEEITRLHRVTQLTEGELPVLFLLDEILHGTNSHDRRIGAEAVVRGLVDRGAVGLVTTHDLALAQVAEALAPRGANVHFQDHLEDGGGRMMRAIGLEV
jgi:hypothetical protein